MLRGWVRVGILVLDIIHRGRVRGGILVLDIILRGIGAYSHIQM